MAHIAVLNARYQAQSDTATLSVEADLHHALFILTAAGAQRPVKEEHDSIKDRCKRHTR
jgi:hypothetical protein